MERCSPAAISFSMHGLRRIRFKEVSMSPELLEGVRRRYNVIDDETCINVFSCDIEKKQLGGITRFHKDELNIAFLQSTGSASNAWSLTGPDGLHCGDISGRNGDKSSWLANKSDGSSFTVIEQKKLPQSIMRSALELSENAFSIVRGDQEVGVIARLARGKPQAKRRGLFRHITRLVTSYDWVLQMGEDFSEEEIMLFSSAALATLEITLTMDRAA